MEEMLERYLENHSSQENDVLKELNRFTHLYFVNPQMLSGQILGGFLRMISRMIKPRYILEIGTFSGYSAICLAEGLMDNGKLITIEVNDELAELATAYFKKADIDDRVELIVGDAINIIPLLNHTFDLVFMDANKEQYTGYYDLIIEKVRSDGYIIADNVLWGGKVIDDVANDPATKAIRDFNKRVNQDHRVENLILPIRDGIMLIRKL